MSNPGGQQRMEDLLRQTGSLEWYELDWLEKRRAKLEKAMLEEACAELELLRKFAKPDDPADLTMPEIGQKLLPFIVPRKLRTAVAGDLAEDFRTYAARWGRPYAVYWLWWEFAGLCIHRFGPTAIVTAIGVWARQKLGW